VCVRLGQATGKSFVCGNAGANQYGTDNMAERIRYKNVADESALVVTLISGDTTRGLAEAEGRYFFTSPPPGPLKALWEAATYVVWRLYHVLRPLEAAHRGDDDVRVAERSLENLFAAIRETQRPGRKVLIVFSPVKDELNGREGELTRRVRAALARSSFDVLDLTGPVSAAVTDDFYYDTVHLDLRGHRFYADAIAERLAPAFKTAP